MKTAELLVTALAVALTFDACAQSTPVAPSGSAGAAQVTTTISPVPMPIQVQEVPSSSTRRYQLAGEVTFRDSTGIGGRITQMTVTIVSDPNATARSSTTALNLVLPAGSAVRQLLSQVVEGIAGQTPSRLELSASGVDPAGKAIVIAAAQAPLALTAPMTAGPLNHVFIVVEENNAFDDVIDGSQMPYLKSLANQYALATQYYANTHPSIGNYFMMTVGTIVSTSSSYSGTVTDDNIVRQLVAAGLTWKSYAEDLPAVGYTGGDTGRYARRHNVFALFSDVVSSPTQVRNLVPFTQFAADLTGNAFPNYSFIVPNLCNDGHDCPLGTVDAWLQSNIGPLIGSSQFQRDGLLIIVFDEGADADQTHGGGHVSWVAVSARAKRGYRSSTFFQHESTLRLSAEVLGLTAFPNLAASAPSMREFFTF